MIVILIWRYCQNFFHLRSHPTSKSLDHAPTRPRGFRCLLRCHRYLTSTKFIHLFVHIRTSFLRSTANNQRSLLHLICRSLYDRCVNSLLQQFWRRCGDIDGSTLETGLKGLTSLGQSWLRGFNTSPEHIIQLFVLAIVWYRVNRVPTGECSVVRHYFIGSPHLFNDYGLTFNVVRSVF